jgi:purine-binding chemotaxis protein CheW
MPEQAVIKETEAQKRAGKFLAFTLAGEEYGLEILKVREIIGMMDITPVPLTPAFIKGIINLRGRVIPVTDLRTKFAMPAVEADSPTCIIVVYVGQTEVGLVVDSVSEVLNVSPADIEETPNFGAALDTRFILGIGKGGGKVTILLDIDKVLTDDEVRAVSASTV